MIERGDHFSDILLYLERKGADDDLKKEAAAKLEKHRQASESEKAKRKSYPVSAAKIVFGTLFLGLTLYLQHFGIIAFPWTLLGYFAATGALAEIIKIIINITRRS
jgi:hypothetical protein